METLITILQWGANLALLAIIGLYKMHTKLRADFETCKQEQALTYIPRKEVNQLVGDQGRELKEAITHLGEKVDRLYELLLYNRTHDDAK